jgi:hypothetical protein
MPPQDGFDIFGSDHAAPVGHSFDFLEDGQQIRSVLLGIELPVLGRVTPTGGRSS